MYCSLENLWGLILFFYALSTVKHTWIPCRESSTGIISEEFSQTSSASKGELELSLRNHYAN